MKYRGAATRIGATLVIQPKPAVTQVRWVWPQMMRRVAASTSLRLRSMRRFSSPSPSRQRDGVDVLVGTDQREAQIRLARVALCVAADQPAAHPEAHQGTGARVENRRPHHEAGNGVIHVADAEAERARQAPQDAREGSEQDRCLKQPDAEIGGQLGEMARILVHALVRVDADGSRVRQPECALRLHPVVDEALHQAFPELELQGFVEPALRDIQDQQAAGDQEKNAELIEEFAQIAPRQRIEERLVPAIEPDLPVRGRGDDDHGRHHQGDERLAGVGGEDRAGQRAHLGREAGRRRVGLRSRTGDVGRAISHCAGRLATHRWARIPVISTRCREPRRGSRAR